MTKTESFSGGRASDILDGDVPGLVLLLSANLDLDVTAERGEKAHQPFERNFGEFSPQDFRQFRLRGSDPPCGGALSQAERPDRVAEPKHEFGLQEMLLGIGKPELQPHVSR